MASVLCVDDDPFLLDTLRLVLRAHFQVLAAGSAEEALGLLGERQVDVILADVGLPGMCGLTFLALARRLAPGAARVLLTGDASAVPDLPRACEAQVFQVLEKPVLADDLIRSLEEAAAHAAVSRRALGPVAHPPRA